MTWEDVVLGDDSHNALMGTRDYEKKNKIAIPNHCAACPLHILTIPWTIFRPKYSASV